MVSWISPSFSEMRLKIKLYRPCISSEDSGKEFVVCDEDVLVGITIVGHSFTCGNVLKVEVGKMLLTRINQKKW